MDYMLLTDKGVKLKNEMGAQRGGAKGCIGVDHVGSEAQAIVAAVLWAGYSKVLLKSDNERAMLRVFAKARKQSKDENLEIVVRRELGPVRRPEQSGSQDWMQVATWSGWCDVEWL